MMDEEFLLAFETCVLPPANFHHVDHVRLAWIYLRRWPALEALGRFCTGLQRFALSLGKPGLYHETITWAHLFLIRERMERHDAASFSEFAATNPDLLTWTPSVLDRYYQKHTLDSDLARRVFLLPDRVA